MTRLIYVCRPEARAVGSKHLVCYKHIAVFIKSKLELGIGNDDTVLRSIISASLV